MTGEMPIVLVGGPHDGSELSVPPSTLRVLKYDDAGDAHAYRVTGRIVGGAVLFEHVGVELLSW